MEMLAMVGMTAVAAVALGYPLFADARRRGIQTPGVSGDLLHRKTSIYRDIKDLEFDREMGKVSDGDYKTMRMDYEAEAVRVLEAMDEGGNGRADCKTSVEKAACPACGVALGPKARFCPSCGQALGGVCSVCRTPVRAEDRFCAGCGGLLLHDGEK